MADNWGDEPIEDEFVFAHVRSNRFGVPSNIMGRHNEDLNRILGLVSGGQHLSTQDN